MARLLPGVYSAINDLSQMPEGAQSLNVGYIVKANRGSVNEFNQVVSPTDFLTKYTFSGTPDLTDDLTMQSIIKVMAQTSSVYIVRAANNPLYGGAIVKKAQEYGPVLGVDQAEESFLLMVPVIKDEEGKKVEGPKPQEKEPITVAGTGLFDGKYVVKKVSEHSYPYSYEDEYGETHDYEVYEITAEGEDPIAFNTTGLGYQILSSGKVSTVSSGTPVSTEYYFEVQGDITEDFDALEGGQIVLTVAGDSQPGSSGVDAKSNNGYYVFKRYELHQNEKEEYSTYIYIDSKVSSDIFNIEIEDLEVKDRGQLFVNNKFQGTSTYRTPVVALSNLKIEDIYGIVYEKNEETGVTTKKVLVHGDVSGKFAVNDRIMIKDSPLENDETNDGTYTVTKVKYIDDENYTEISVKEKFKFPVPHEEGKTKGGVYFESMVSPEAVIESLGEDDLMLITGIDQGAYNGQEAFSIVSSFDNKEALVYYKGAEGLFPEPCTFDTMQLTVYNADTNEPLESFTFSRDPQAKAIDGTSLYVDDVIEGSSAYIKVFNNTKFDNTDVPNSTLAGSPVQASGGYDGAPVTPSDMVRALSVFQDKTIPISILGNGCSEEAESPIFQQALLELANTRKDCFVFLNDRARDEKATLPSTRAQNIVNYKKNQLASTSFYGCMYAPHVNTPDIYNSRNVKIGSDAVAIAGWLNVINTLKYPYAYAGPRNGLVSGVTCDWKIGDMSGEAEMLNDASINYIAYDGRAGRYYMQCQNTLQIANSAMRNIGVVLNVLDIKENLVTYLKEFLNLPITDSLRRDIMDTVGDYLSPMTGTRFYNYVFQDTTTDADLAEDTLRYLLTLSPTRYAQRIYLVMNIVRTGFDFSILQSM